MRINFITLFLCCAVFACSSSNTEPVTDVSTPDQSPSDVRFVPPDTNTPPDTQPQPDSTNPFEGTILGNPCSGNEDCPEGWCVHGKDGDVCTLPCVTDCPQGWTCKQLPVAGDLSFVCLPLHITLCRPCTEPSVCKDGGYQDTAICSNMGDKGSFCLTPCDSTAVCPENYSCKQVNAPQGIADYCVPDSGDCDCDQVATAQQMSTECLNSNQWGTCIGNRQCAQDGLTECDATKPAKDICNEIDDNCDGETDEDCCGGVGESCCPGDECQAPFECIEGTCICDPAANVVCSLGDVYQQDCQGGNITLKEDCGSCPCIDGACLQQDTQSICHDGDVWSQDCTGAALELLEDCGSCTCQNGACAGSSGSNICDQGNVWTQGCDGGPLALLQQCGVCGCDDGVCLSQDNFTQVCNNNQVWLKDCNGALTSMVAVCGECGCSNGVCLPDSQGPQVCSNGDVWATGCTGQLSNLVQECGTCGCENGSCLTSGNASLVCHEGDTWWQSCNGDLLNKFEECGECNCSGGQCIQGNTGAPMCHQGDVWSQNCSGGPATLLQDCTCGCSGGQCLGQCQPGDMDFSFCDPCSERSCNDQCQWNECQLKATSECEHQSGTNWKCCAPGKWHFCLLPSQNNTGNCIWSPQCVDCEWGNCDNFTPE